MFCDAINDVDQNMNGRIGHLDDWVAETPESIAARLESARNAQAQARRTMGVMSIISMMMLIASYNAYLSYDTTWVLDLAGKKLTGDAPGCAPIFCDIRKSRVTTVSIESLPASAADTSPSHRVDRLHLPTRKEVGA